MQLQNFYDYLCSLNVIHPSTSTGHDFVLLMSLILVTWLLLGSNPFGLGLITELVHWITITCHIKQPFTLILLVVYFISAY